MSTARAHNQIVRNGKYAGMIRKGQFFDEFCADDSKIVAGEGGPTHNRLHIKLRINVKKTQFVEKRQQILDLIMRLANEHYFVLNMFKGLTTERFIQDANSRFSDGVQFTLYLFDTVLDSEVKKRELNTFIDKLHLGLKRLGVKAGTMDEQDSAIDPLRKQRALLSFRQDKLKPHGAYIHARVDKQFRKELKEKQESSELAKAIQPAKAAIAKREQVMPLRDVPRGQRMFAASGQAGSEEARSQSAALLALKAVLDALMEWIAPLLLLVDPESYIRMQMR